VYLCAVVASSQTISLARHTTHTQRMKRRILRPPICDLSQSDDKIRNVIRKALRGTLSPAMTVVGHGCESQIANVVKCMRDRQDIKRTLQDEKTSQKAFDIVNGSLEDKREKLKTCLESVCKKLLSLASNHEKKSAPDLNGRLCFRVYPKQDKEKHRLGAHVDHTLMTLLYSNCA